MVETQETDSETAEESDDQTTGQSSSCIYGREESAEPLTKMKTQDLTCYKMRTYLVWKDHYSFFQKLYVSVCVQSRNICKETHKTFHDAASQPVLFAGCVVV